MVRTLSAGHVARGHRVVVIAVVDAQDHPFVRALTGTGVEVRPLHIAGHQYRGERRFVSELLRTLRPHVLHSHGYRPDILDVGVARRLRIPTVTTLHGFTGGDWKMRVYERWQMQSIRRADAVVAVSRSVYDRARQGGVRAERIHTIQNAYAPLDTFLSRADARRTLGIAEQEIRLGWIGRLSWEKGGDVMIDALARLADLPVSLSYIGDGPDRDVVMARARALGVAERVTWHGVLPGAARFLPAFDAFVLSSRTEGTPMVVLEAMAAGVPIVATRVGGIHEMLSNTEAMLVASEAPDALADAVRRVLADPAAAATRVDAARARLQRDFSVDPWLARHEALYLGLSHRKTP